MGEVYPAIDHRLGRPVALTVLPTETTGDPGRLARFRATPRDTLSRPDATGAGLAYGSIAPVWSASRFRSTTRRWRRFAGRRRGCVGRRVTSCAMRWPTMPPGRIA